MSITANQEKLIQERIKTIIDEVFEKLDHVESSLIAGILNATKKELWEQGVEYTINMVFDALMKERFYTSRCFLFCQNVEETAKSRLADVFYFKTTRKAEDLLQNFSVERECKICGQRHEFTAKNAAFIFSKR